MSPVSRLVRLASVAVLGTLLAPAAASAAGDADRCMSVISTFDRTFDATRDVSAPDVVDHARFLRSEAYAACRGGSDEQTVATMLDDAYAALGTRPHAAPEGEIDASALSGYN